MSERMLDRGFETSGARAAVRVRRGGGCNALFGLPFFLAGMAVLVLGLSGKMKDSKTGAPAPRAFALLFPIPFILVGGGLILGRSGLHVDPVAGTVRKWWGLLVPMGGTTRRFEEFDRATLERRVVRSDKSTRTIYPVTLHGDSSPFQIDSDGDYRKARRLAEQVARALHVPLHDLTGPAPAIRPPESLDESLRDRARRLGLEHPWPGPASGRITRATVRDTTVLVLPHTGVVLGSLLIAIVPMAFLLFVGTTFLIPMSRDFSSEDLENPLAWVFLGFLSLFALIPGGIALRAALGAFGWSERIAVSPQGIRIERRAVVGARSWTLPSREIEELTAAEEGSGVVTFRKGDADPVPAPPAVQALVTTMTGGRGGGLRIQSDRRMCVFGTHLDPHEIAWLQAALMYLLAGDEPPPAD